MASDNYMDDEAAPSTAENELGVTPDEKGDETEDQLALVPNHFFRNPPKPGMQEKVEVVEVYENESSIKCIYDKDKDEDKEEESEEEYAQMPEPEDEMMA